METGGGEIENVLRVDKIRWFRPYESSCEEYCRRSCRETRREVHGDEQSGAEPVPARSCFDRWLSSVSFRLEIRQIIVFISQSFLFGAEVIATVLILVYSRMKRGFLFFVNCSRSIRSRTWLSLIAGCSSNDWVIQPLHSVLLDRRCRKARRHSSRSFTKRSPKSCTIARCIEY